MADITASAMQKISKPNIEDVLPHFLDGEALRNALDFAAYLRENKTKPSWKFHNSWCAVNKGKIYCYIRLSAPNREAGFYHPNHPDEKSWERSWCITPWLSNLAKYEHLITDDVDKKIIADNLYGCVPYCRKNNCAPKKRITVCGTEIVRYCHGMLDNRSLWVVNPDKTEIDSIKKLLELEKQARIKT